MFICSYQSQPDISVVWLQNSSLFVHVQGLVVATRVVVQRSEWSQDINFPGHLQGPAEVRGHQFGFT